MTNFANHVKSFLITFFATFIPLALPMLGGDTLSKSALIALGLAACRTILKVLGEMLIGVKTV